MAAQEMGEPRNARKRGLVFMVVVFAAFMQAGLYAARQESSPPLSAWIPSTEAIFRSTAQKPLDTKITEHPIPRLMAEAEDKFRGLLARQSKTLEAAVEEYRRRYGREPPKGFDGWWEFLQQYNVKIVDEYDGLMEDLAPYMELSGEEIRRRVNQVGHLPSIDLVRLENGKARALNIQKDFIDDEVSARAQGLRRMVEKFQGKLPDMDFPVNAKAEGRILVPWEFQKYPNLTHQDSSVGINVMLGGEFQPDWRGDGNVWESFRRVCDPESQARRLFGSQRMNAENIRPVNLLDPTGLASGPGEDFEFPDDVDNKFSFCDHPWAHYQQGHFFSDWRTIPVLYPVFSPAKTDGYGDIRIPSHYYHQSTSAYTYGWDPITQMAKEFDDNELAWENKSDVIFWRGATTGGGSSPPGFSAHYQRHRFVRMSSEMSDDERTVVFADPPSSSDYTYARVPIKKLNQEIMDVAFVSSTGYVNYPGGREALYKYHRFADRVPLSEHWKYKYLVDFDGMGYSGRLFAFLASDSAVIKSTVYKEYFSDYIQPWLHYIPLSQGYQEIYNVYSFFHGPTESMLEAANSTALYDSTISRNSEETDRLLRRIARAGKHWKQTMGRKIDMEAYTYRLCLEWARLWADDRESMNFTLPSNQDN